MRTRFFRSGLLSKYGLLSKSGLLSRSGMATAVGLALSVMPSGRPAYAQQATGSSAMIVLDGSNSMNARLPNDKAFKHVAVREALRASLPGATGSVEIGLAAFGGRRERDCNDAEVIVQPSNEAQRVVDALEKFQPRGFSPVVLAMRTAAKALPPDRAKTSMILVLDDLASCRGEDPCAVATDLKRQNAALSIHVVGLGLKRPDAQVLACIARQTGGQLIEAMDGPSVGPAIAQALKLVGIDKTAPAETRAAPVAPAPRPATRTPERRAAGSGVPIIDETQPGVHFTARLADGRPLLGVPLRWRITVADEAEKTAAAGRGDAAADVTVPAFTQWLAAGKYVAEASGGLVKVRRAFEVAGPGPTRVPLVLDAALLQVVASLSKGTGAAAGARITISGGGESQDQSLAPLWVTGDGTLQLLVPPGAYRIKAEAGVAAAERAVAVSAGLSSEIEIDLAAGRLQVDETGGPPPGDARLPQIIVAADDPDSSGARRELYRASAARLDLTVPSGTYLVTFRHGESETRERYVVRAGETARRNLTPAIARVRLISRGTGAARPGLELRYRIERLEGAARVLQRWGEPEPVIDLTPGRYRFEARLGGQNAVAVREAEIKAGFEHRVEFDLAAGAVQLKLQNGSTSLGTSLGIGLGLGDVYWQIQDERGATVWRTIETEPVLALGAGRYRVRVEVKDREFEQTIDVKAGDFRVIELGG